MRSIKELAPESESLGLTTDGAKCESVKLHLA